MKQRIVAIGGGDFRKYKTLSIDTEIVRLAGLQRPQLLFIPTASNDSQQYSTSIIQHFTELGCDVAVLLLIKETPTYDTIKTMIDAADIIYVGGGNTLRMMTLWRRLGVDILLESARSRGAVLCGVSAGSICWFAHGNSDSRKDKNPAAEYIKVTALGFIPALNCPHYDTESDRKESLKKMMKRYKGIAIALEDCAAVEVVGDEYRILISQPQARAYKVYWQNGVFVEKSIEVLHDFRLLSNLLKE